jgi:DnaJ-domain-containing protein 1
VAEEPTFKDDREELRFHLIRSEYHLRKALVVLMRLNPRRSLMYSALLSRAHQIALALYHQEEARGDDGKSVHGHDHST